MIRGIFTIWFLLLALSTVNGQSKFDEILNNFILKGKSLDRYGVEIDSMQGMTKEELKILRNAIFAKHGYRFKNQGLLDYFKESYSWYNPRYDDVKIKNKVDLANLRLIQVLETPKELRFKKLAEQFNQIQFPFDLSREALFNDYYQEELCGYYTLTYIKPSYDGGYFYSYYHAIGKIAETDNFIALLYRGDLPLDNTEAWYTLAIQKKDGEPISEYTVARISYRELITAYITEDLVITIKHFDRTGNGFDKEPARVEKKKVNNFGEIIDNI